MLMPQVPTQDFASIAEKANRNKAATRLASKAARTCKGETRSSLSLSPADPPDPKLCPGAKLGINAPLLWEGRGKRYGNPDAKSNRTPLPLPSVTERGIAWYRNPRARDHLGRTPARPHAAEFQREVQHRSPCASQIRCSRPASQPVSQSVSVLRPDLLRVLPGAEICHAKNRTAPHRTASVAGSIRFVSTRNEPPFRSGPKEVAGQDAEARHADSAPQASVCRARLGAGTAPVGRTWREVLCNAASLVALGKVLGWVVAVKGEKRALGEEEGW